MHAVIMAGGKGTRLQEITKGEIPKPMAPVLGKPLLLWQTERLKAAGITVLAGCSARRTTEYVNEDGKTIKKSEFEFVGFKEY